MARLDIWKAREDGNREVLRAASSEEIADGVVALGEKNESFKSIDFDRIMSIGVWLASAGHESADENVVQWFVLNPTARRLDIAAALLNGLWLAQSRHRPVGATLIAKLGAAKLPTATSPGAEYGVATAMIQVLRDARAVPETIQIAASVIEDIMARGTGDAILDRQLASGAPLEIAKARARVRDIRAQNPTDA